MVCLYGEFEGFRPPYKTPREFGNYSVLIFEKRDFTEGKKMDSEQAKKIAGIDFGGGKCHVAIFNQGLTGIPAVDFQKLKNQEKTRIGSEKPISEKVLTPKGLVEFANDGGFADIYLAASEYEHLGYGRLNARSKSKPLSPEQHINFFESLKKSNCEVALISGKRRGYVSGLFGIRKKPGKDMDDAKHTAIVGYYDFKKGNATLPKLGLAECEKGRKELENLGEIFRQIDIAKNSNYQKNDLYDPERFDVLADAIISHLRWIAITNPYKVASGVPANYKTKDKFLSDIKQFLEMKKVYSHYPNFVERVALGMTMTQIYPLSAVVINPENGRWRNLGGKPISCEYAIRRVFNLSPHRLRGGVVSAHCRWFRQRNDFKKFTIAKKTNTNQCQFENIDFEWAEPNLNLIDDKWPAISVKEKGKIYTKEEFEFMEKGRKVLNQSMKAIAKSIFQYLHKVTPMGGSILEIPSNEVNQYRDLF